MNIIVPIYLIIQLNIIYAIIDKFSIITPTFKRDIVLGHYLHRYAVELPKKMEELHKIYIIWMNIDRKPELSPIIMAEKSKWKVGVEFIIPPKNDLNYRFVVPKNLETEAVMSLDDDLIMNPDDIRKAFLAWKLKWNGSVAPIIGFYPRDYSYNSRGGLVYSFFTENHYSMILTGACFLSKKFLVLYNDGNLKEAVAIRRFVSQNMNAEDIGMNFLVAAFFPSLPPIWIKGVEIKEDKDVNRNGLSYQPSHGIKRSLALNEFVKVFGRNPLKRVAIK